MRLGEGATLTFPGIDQPTLTMSHVLPTTAFIQNINDSSETSPTSETPPSSETSPSSNTPPKKHGKPNATTGLIGVFKDGKTYRAKIRIDGTTHYLGTFNTKEEAGIAYDQFVVDKSTDELIYALNYPKMSHQESDQKEYDDEEDDDTDEDEGSCCWPVVFG